MSLNWKADLQVLAILNEVPLVDIESSSLESAVSILAHQELLWQVAEEDEKLFLSRMMLDVFSSIGRYCMVLSCLPSGYLT